MFFYVRIFFFCFFSCFTLLFQKQMTRSVSLHPSFFGKNFQETLELKLKQDCEGIWSETYGFIVLVAEVSSFGKGKVQEETGHALFTLKFTALVFRVGKKK
jgi:DNA-directed RNA polymerase II subunit RPB7